MTPTDQQWLLRELDQLRTQVEHQARRERDGGSDAAAAAYDICGEMLDDLRTRFQARR